jgi:Zn-finger protein
MKQSLKPYLEELFVMRSCTHLPCLGALSLCMFVFCDLQGHLGGKAKLNHI